MSTTSHSNKLVRSNMSSKNSWIRKPEYQEISEHIYKLWEDGITVINGQSLTTLRELAHEFSRSDATIQNIKNTSTHEEYCKTYNKRQWKAEYDNKNDFKVGDVVKHKTSGYTVKVLSTPGMDEYDRQGFFESHRGFVGDDDSWHLKDEYVLRQDKQPAISTGPEDYSNCCGTRMYDPAGNGEGFCKQCGEHCVSIQKENKLKKDLTLSEQLDMVLDELYELKELINTKW